MNIVLVYNVTITFADGDGFTKQVKTSNPIIAPILAIHGINEKYMQASPIIEIIVKPV